MPEAKLVTWGDFKNLKGRVVRLQASRIRTRRNDREFDERMKKAFLKHKVCSHFGTEHLDDKTASAYRELVRTVAEYEDSIKHQLSPV